MKRAAAIALVLLMGTGAALAASLNVPFFLDNAATGQGFPHATGIMFFVAIKNTTGAPIVVTVNYFDPNGNAINDAGRTTQYLIGGQGVSFRPRFDDPSVEPPVVAGLRRATSNAGSVTITWTGATTDIQGRAVQLDANSGNAFSFLLPPGV